jgi:multimeric flavodoxin WrbA
LAEAVAKGARMVKGTAVTLIPVADRASHWEVLDAADAIVFGCPTYMGSGSSALKAFMEKTIQPQSWSSGGRTSWQPGSRTLRA